MKQQRQRRNSHFLFWQIFFSLLSDPPHSPPPPLWIRFLPRFGIWRQHSGGVIWQCRLSKSTGTLSWAPFLFGEHIRIQGLFQALGRNPLSLFTRIPPKGHIQPTIYLNPFLTPRHRGLDLTKTFTPPPSFDNQISDYKSRRPLKEEKKNNKKEQKKINLTS